jgi:uncharacterized protein (TIGR03435 family)
MDAGERGRMRMILEKESFGDLWVGRLAELPLSVYIQFAYKIWPSPEQTQAMLAPLPKWVATKKFTVHAKAAGNPTKDQMRLMVQALLKERFGLEAHFASVDEPVLTMVLVHPGKLGPKLRRHEGGPPCRADGGRDVGVFPPECDVFEKMPGADHAVLLGSRNATVELMGASLAGAGRLGRPVVDGTGIAGRVDFSVEYLPDMGADAPADAAEGYVSEGGRGAAGDPVQGGEGSGAGAGGGSGGAAYRELESAGADSPWE